MLLQVVLIVFQQFLVTALGYAHQLKFGLERCLSVGESFGDVLLDRPCCLHHLIYGAVTIFGQEARAECFGELYKHIALAIEVQRRIDRCLAHDAWRTIIITLEVFWHIFHTIQISGSKIHLSLDMRPARSAGYIITTEKFAGPVSLVTQAPQLLGEIR